jgi:hypothetical protein
MSPFGCVQSETFEDRCNDMYAVIYGKVVSFTATFYCHCENSVFILLFTHTTSTWIVTSHSLCR